MTNLYILKLLGILLFFSSLMGCVNRYVDPNPNIVSQFEIHSDELLLVVKVIKTSWPGIYPQSGQCPEGYDCIQVSSWYIHEAKVLDVINGNFDEHTIKFAMLQTSDFLKEIKSEWYVQFKQFENEDIINKLSTKYYVDNHSSEFSINH